MKKTNAMRILDSKKINYNEIEYDASSGISALDVAKSTGEDPSRICLLYTSDAADDCCRG